MRATDIPQTDPRPRRPWRNRLIACAASLLLGILLCELTLRVVWTRPPIDRAIHSFDFEQALQRDAELGYVPRANATVHYAPFAATFTTNADGLRGPRVPRAKDPNRKRIVVLGDSFAWGHGVSAGEAFPELLAAALADVDVVNLGVPGYDLPRELALFRRIGLSYKPDLVVLALCQNDIRDAQADAARAAAGEVDNVIASGAAAGSVPPLRAVKQFLHAHSHLFALIQQTVNTSKSLARAAVRLGLKEELAGYELLDDNLRPALVGAPESMCRARQKIIDDIIDIRDAARSAGAEVLVALIPCVQAVDARELTKSIAYTRYGSGDFAMEEAMERIERACDELGVRVVNPLAAFRASFNRGESLYLPGDLHFNPAGHALFAERLLPSIGRALGEPPIDESTPPVRARVSPEWNAP